MPSRSSRPGALVYAFGLLRARAPAVEEAPSGPPDVGRPRLVGIEGGVWLVVADAAPSRFAQGAVEGGRHDRDWVLECALGHERVLEFFLPQGTLVPMRLLTLFASERAARTAVHAARARWAEAFSRLAGRREWAVRLAAVERAKDTRSGERSRLPSAGAGTLFLRERHRRLQEKRGRDERAAAAVQRAFERLSRLAAEVRLAQPGGAFPLLLEAAVLVDEGRRPRFEELAGRLRSDLRSDGVSLRLTGPWPAYSFVGEGR